MLGEEQIAELVGPIRSVAINACEATLKLPSGVTAPRVIAAHDALAEALNIEPGWLDIRQAGHPNRISMWIATSEPFADPRLSPLAENPERQDAWNKGVPIGFNRRGEVVYLKLRHVLALLGGMSRTGKGMLLRSLICGLGLDPRINIRLVAGAKPGEHIGYAPVCATFFGRRPERLLTLLKAFQQEALRREEYLEKQRRSKMSEEDLAQYPWEILIIDELKQYTGKAKPLAKEISDLLEDLAGFIAALNMGSSPEHPGPGRGHRPARLQVQLRGPHGHPYRLPDPDQRHPQGGRHRKRHARPRTPARAQGPDHPGRRRPCRRADQVVHHRGRGLRRGRPDHRRRAPPAGDGGPGPGTVFRRD